MEILPEIKSPHGHSRVLDVDSLFPAWNAVQEYKLVVDAGSLVNGFHILLLRSQ